MRSPCDRLPDWRVQRRAWRGADVRQSPLNRQVKGLRKKEREEPALYIIALPRGRGKTRDPSNILFARGFRLEAQLAAAELAPRAEQPPSMFHRSSKDDWMR
jgi:hypothetical protein